MIHRLTRACAIAVLLGGYGIAAQDDTTRPALSVVNASRDTAVLVIFSEPVDPGAASAGSSYSISNGVHIKEIIWMSGTRVVLSTSRLTSGTTYTLTVNGIPDLADPANVIAPNTQKQFVFVRAQSELPIISPPGPTVTFSSNMTVTMSHPSPAARIRYTLDGSDPTSASTLYGGAPVSVASSLTLKARAFEAGFDSSLAVTVEFVMLAKGAITYPKDGETFAVGDTLTVRFRSYDNAAFNAAYLWVSLDTGMSWKNISTTRYFSDSSSISWVIPSTIERTSLANADAIVEVWQYSGIPIADVAIHISGDNRARRSRLPRADNPRVVFQPAAGKVAVFHPGALRVRLADARGRLRAEAAGIDMAFLHFPAGGSSGCGLLIVETENRRIVRRTAADR